MYDTDWINNLSVGDKVIVSGPWIADSICHVEAINKTTIKVNGVLFNKKDGYRRGDYTFGRWYLVKPTEDRLKQVLESRERTLFKNRLEHINFDKINIETIRKINELLNNATNK